MGVHLIHLEGPKLSIGENGLSGERISDFLEGREAVIEGDRVAPGESVQDAHRFCFFFRVIEMASILFLSQEERMERHESQEREVFFSRSRPEPGSRRESSESEGILVLYRMERRLFVGSLLTDLILHIDKWRDRSVVSHVDDRVLVVHDRLIHSLQSPAGVSGTPCRQLHPTNEPGASDGRIQVHLRVQQVRVLGCQEVDQQRRQVESCVLHLHYFSPERLLRHIHPSTPTETFLVLGRKVQIDCITDVTLQLLDVLVASVTVHLVDLRRDSVDKVRSCQVLSDWKVVVSKTGTLHVQTIQSPIVSQFQHFLLN